MSRSISPLTRKPLAVLSVALLAAGLAASRAAAVEIDMNSYAAVAFSTSTGAYGYAWNQGTKEEAESAALKRCKADDAEIVGWVQGGWLVLVIGDNDGYGVGWQYGDGADSNVPLRRALNNCLQHSQKISTVIRVCSGDFDPTVVSFNPAIDPSKIHTDDEHPLPQSNNDQSLPAGSIGPAAK